MQVAAFALANAFEEVLSPSTYCYAMRCEGDIWKTKTTTASTGYNILVKDQGRRMYLIEFEIISHEFR